MTLEGCLNGVTIITIAEQIPGPLATRILGDLGARIIMVEKPEDGDPARQAPDIFAWLNHDKCSLGLNVKTVGGLEVLRRLVASADGVIQGLRPGTAKRLGIDYATLSRVNPQLVYVALSGYGQDGPYCERPVHDLTVQGLAGLIDGDFIPPVIWADICGALYGALAMVTGLWHTREKSDGVFIDLAMLDSLISVLGIPLLGQLTEQFRSDFRGDPAYHVYRSSDGQEFSVSIVDEEKFWHKLCRVVEMPEWQEWSTTYRRQNATQIRNRLREIFSARSWRTWEAMLSRSNVPFGPVWHGHEVGNDPQVIHRGMLRQRLSDGVWTVGSPLVRQIPSEGPINVPVLGQHNEDILQALEYSPKQIEDLYAEGALFPTPTS